MEEYLKNMMQYIKIDKKSDNNNAVMRKMNYIGVIVLLVIVLAAGNIILRKIRQKYNGLPMKK